MFCDVEGDNIIVRIMLDSSNKKIELEEIQSHGILKMSTQPMARKAAGSAGENPAKASTPVTAPQPGHAGPGNGKDSFYMEEINQNPDQSGSTPLTQPQAPKVEKLSGKITVRTDGKKEVALELNVGKDENFDTLKKWKNSANPQEFCVFIKLSGKTLYITGYYDSKREASGNVVTINSVGIPGTETVCGSNNLEEMKGLVGLNETTKVDVEISNAPFKAPEVKRPETSTASPQRPEPAAAGNRNIVPKEKKLVLSPELIAYLDSKSLKKEIVYGSVVSNSSLYRVEAFRVRNMQFRQVAPSSTSADPRPEQIDRRQPVNTQQVAGNSRQ